MPTLLLYNGPIYTLDPSMPRAQALAVRDGRVIAAGSEGKVQAVVGGRAEAYNLNGRAVIPALTDAHAHLIWHALARRAVQLEGITDYDQAVRLVAEAALARPAGSWVTGGGWDHTLWGGRWPAAADLDAVAPDRPILISRKDGHSAWANSLALKLAGIDDQTPDPPGGSIKREKGSATGLLLETAIDLVRHYIPEPSQEERLDAIREALVEAHSYGMAGMHIPPGLRPHDGALTLGDLSLLRERGGLKLRSLVHIGLDGLDDALRLGIRSGLGDRWLRIGNVKMFADGSLGSETAEMLSHYEGRRHLGAQTMTTEELNEAVARAISGGISVIVHAIGDAANRRVLDAIELALKLRMENAELRNDGDQRPDSQLSILNSQFPIPNRIEHCQILHPRDIPRFAELGVVASMQPIHCTADLATADALWGERCATAYAWRSLKESGAVLAFGSDAPVESLNPWYSVHAAVTRQRRDGTPPGGWYPAQCISVADALWGFTVGAAIAAGSSEQGTLMPGMLADLAVLSADPFKIEPAELHTINAEMTMIEGDVVWEKRS